MGLRIYRNPYERKTNPTNNNKRKHIMQDKDTTDMQYRKDYYQLNREKYRAKALEYYHKNKERLNENKRALKMEEVQAQMTLNPKPVSFKAVEPAPIKRKRVPRRTKPTSVFDPVPPLDGDNGAYTMIDIAKMIGITYERLRSRIAKDKRYMMPAHMYTRLDGSKLYNKKEIDDWLPYIVDLLAFDPSAHKKARITLSGDAVHIVNFMRKNKKVIAHCDKERTRLRGLWLDSLTSR
jgi:hypothetical protein